MPTLHIEMPGGVAGDMLLAALLECGGDLAGLVRDLAGLGLGTVEIAEERLTRSGIGARRIRVAAPQEAAWVQPAVVDRQADDDRQRRHHHHHHHHHHHLQHHQHDADHPSHPDPASPHAHRPYREVRRLLADADLPGRVRERSAAVFRLLAEAEAAVHGVAVDEVVFHEVGGIDALVDVVGCCLLLERLEVDRICTGPILLGSGGVRCAHGEMPVPVPAVLEILARSGSPARRAAVDGETGELTTPTGAALVCALADAHEPPDGRVQAVGYGAGQRTVRGLLPVVRASLVAEDGTTSQRTDLVVELRCQIDDGTGEELAVLCETLQRAGALDTVLAPVLMKKGRPGHLLLVLAPPELAEPLGDLILARSPTIGLRQQELVRRVLPREESACTVEGRTIRCKTVQLPDGRRRRRPEADDVAAVAEALGLSFAEIHRRACADMDSGPAADVSAGV